MKSERLVVLVSREEKARIVELAEAQDTSVAELVRSAISAEVLVDGQTGKPGNAPALSPDQVAALERLAEVAMATMTRANAALDKAFEEIEATKAYFADKRTRSETSA